METVRVETIVQPNGRVIVDNLPFHEGEKVEIIISEAKEETDSSDRYPLRGTTYSYLYPFDPAVPPDEWEVIE